jgi:alpha-tubulin suppressor-like RCC1 family protein
VPIPCVQVSIRAGIASAIPVGVDFACTLRDGAVWCWGDDHRGQLGDNQTTPQARPVKVVGISDAISVVAGEGHACALRAGGRVSCWGRNESGEVGSGDRDDQLSPVEVAALGPATAVSAGGLHTCARLADATAWCWGNNEKGQLGFTGFSTSLPSQVLDDVVAIAVGEQHN